MSFKSNLIPLDTMTRPLIFAKSRFGVCIIAVVIVFGTLLIQDSSASAQVARSINDGMLLIAVDGNAFRDDDVDAVLTAGSSLLSKAQTGVISIGVYEETPQEPKTYPTIEAAKEDLASIVSTLRDREAGDTTRSGLGAMLAKYGTYLTSWDAPEGSRLVVLSAGVFDDAETMTPENVGVFAGHFAQEGYKIDAVSLPTTAAPDREVLDRVARETGGNYHDMGFVEGAINFFKYALQTEFKDTQQFAGDTDTPISHVIEVPPHSTRLLAGLGSENPDLNKTLTSPGGQDFNESLGNVELFYSRTLSIYAVKDPEPGSWVLSSDGGDADVVLISDIDNPVVLSMPETIPFPVGEPLLLTVDAKSGDLPHVDTQAVVEAEVLIEGGSAETFTLRDSGTDGDANLQDGTYSALLPAQDQTGVRRVSFKMKWQGIDAFIETNGIFSVDPFPIVSVNPSDSTDATAGRMLIANLELSVGGYPYLAAPSELSVQITEATTENQIATEIEAVALQDDKAYQYRVFANVTVEGTYGISVSLNTNYLGREYVFDAETLSSSVVFAVPPGFNYIPVAVAGVALALLIVGFMVYANLKPKPYGYIYKSDFVGNHELVADFKSYRFAFLEKLWGATNVVPAAALQAIPLRGGSFVFRREGLAFSYRPEIDGLLRMNIRNTPVREGLTPIDEGSPIAIAHESYVFYRDPIVGDVQISPHLQEEEPEERLDLSRFTNDPMTFDAPSSVRPTRRG